MQGGSQILRRMTAGDVVIEAVRLIVRDLGSVLVGVVVVALPLSVAGGALVGWAEWESTHRYTRQTSAVGPSWVPLLAALLGATVLLLLVVPLMSGMYATIVGERFLGARPSAGRVVARFVRRLPALLAASFEIFLLVLLLYVMLVFGLIAMTVGIVDIADAVGSTPTSGLVETIAGGAAAALGFFALVWLAPFVMVAAPGAVLEPMSGWSAVRKARSLAAGNWIHTMSVTFIVYALVGGATYGLNYLVIVDVQHGTLHDAVVWSVVQRALFAVIVVPFVAMCTAVLAVDLRVRRESYDVDQLALDLADSSGTVDRAHAFTNQPVTLKGIAARAAATAAAERAAAQSGPTEPIP